MVAVRFSVFGFRVSGVSDKFSLFQKISQNYLLVVGGA
jgi:hypothetical protein